MAGDKKEPEEKGEKTGFVLVEFTKQFNDHEKGSTRVYHKTAAVAVCDRLKVGKIVKELTKFVPEKEEK